MKLPDVSVIIPVYNAEAYLRQCVDSILSQTFENLEVICIDDGSPDGSLHILNEYDDERLVVISQENQGVSRARNNALKYAKGRYICYVDSDDWLDEQTVEVLYNKAESTGADAVMCTYVKEFGSHSVVKHMPIEPDKEFKGTEFFKHIYRKMIGPLDKELKHPEDADLLIAPWGQLFRRSMIEGIEFEDMKRIGSEDLLYQLEVYRRCSLFVYVDVPFYHYRRSDYGTLTTKHTPSKYKRFLRLYDRIEELITDIPESADYDNALNNRVAMGMIGLGLNEIYSDSSLKKKSKGLKEILSNGRYKRAFKTLKYRYLPFHWFVFFALCKIRMTYCLILMLYCVEYMRKHAQ